MELWADNYDIFRMCQLEHWTSTTRLVQPPKAGGTVRIQALPQKTRLSRSCQFTFFLLCYRWWVPGTTRPRRLLTLWPLPEYQRVIGFSFQLAIIQHQFALHALGYCHLCKDGEGASRGRPCFAFLGVVLIGVA